MVADLSVYLDTGGVDTAPGTITDTDVVPGAPPNIRFKRADNPTIDAVNPCTIPPAGTSYSRWKCIYLRCDVAPSTQVDNIRIYTDGTGFGTGITVKVLDATPTKNSGSSAGYKVSDTDDELMTDAGAFGGTSTDFFTFVVGAPKSVTISEAGSIINAIGETCNYVVLQMEIINTASPGDLANETWTWRYDEI